MRTPEQWLDRLNTTLLLRQSRIKRFDDYYRGTQTLSFASKKFRDVFGSLFSNLAVNYCVLIVDAERDRLKVEGFRMGADHNADADTDAWRIWQGNQLDAFSPTAHVEALVKEESYALVSPFRAEWPAADVPLITLEDPLQSIVEFSSANRRQRLAGLKRWLDDEGNVCANLYLPDAIYKYIQRGKVDTSVQLITPASILLGEIPAQGWEPRVVEGEEWPLPNPLGVVPMVRLVNRPRLDGYGESELATVLPIQDAINKTVADMLLAAEFAAFRQKWGINIPIETDEDGKPKEPFNIAIDKLLVVEPGEQGDPQASFGEFSATDLRPYVAAKEGFIQDLSSITADAGALPARPVGPVPVGRVAHRDRDRARREGASAAAPLRRGVGGGRPARRSGPSRTRAARSRTPRRSGATREPDRVAARRLAREDVHARRAQRDPVGEVGREPPGDRPLEGHGGRAGADAAGTASEPVHRDPGVGACRRVGARPRTARTWRGSRAARRALAPPGGDVGADPRRRDPGLVRRAGRAGGGPPDHRRPGERARDDSRLHPRPRGAARGPVLEARHDAGRLDLGGDRLDRQRRPRRDRRGALRPGRARLGQGAARPDGRRGVHPDRRRRDDRSGQGDQPFHRLAGHHLRRRRRLRQERRRSLVRRRDGPARQLPVRSRAYRGVTTALQSAGRRSYDV
jgi:hypothetical protein